MGRNLDFFTWPYQLMVVCGDCRSRTLLLPYYRDDCEDFM